MLHPGSTQRKKRRIQPQRIAVDLEPPSGGSTSFFGNVTARIECLQPSTGKRYQGERTLVVDTFCLPPEDTAVGLDPDSSKNEQLVDSNVIENEGGHNDIDSKKRKRRNRSLASVSLCASINELTSDWYSNVRWSLGRLAFATSISTNCCVGRDEVIPGVEAIRNVRIA